MINLISRFKVHCFKVKALTTLEFAEVQAEDDEHVMRFRQ